jgi:hypothetical protein
MAIAVQSGSSPLLIDSLKDLPGFIARLRQQSDPICALLWKGLSNDEQVLMLNYQPTARAAKQVEGVAVDALNRMVRVLPLYSAERFKGISLGADTKALIGELRIGFTHEYPPGAELARFNRLLLADAFPGELAVKLPLRAPSVSVADPVILVLAFTNSSINDTFWIVNEHDIEIDWRYAFQVITPLGKHIETKGNFMRARAQQGDVLDAKHRDIRFRFILSNICKFDDIGTYTITASRQVDWEGHPSFTAVSNPLKINIVPDK